MENGLVSIIIPVYNVKNYLESCVKSCLAQTYASIEILLIDDGSTDGSAELCESLAKGNVRAFHKENGGLSDARNFGIPLAKGEYLMFVDSDDVIAPDLVAALLDAMGDADVASCNFSHFADGETPEFAIKGRPESMSAEEALTEFFYQKKISTSSCAKLYRADAVRDVRFVKGQRFEDNEYLFCVFGKCRKVAYLDANLYGYRHRSASLTTSRFSEKDFDILAIGQSIEGRLATYSEEIQRAFVAYQCANAMRIYLTATEQYDGDERVAYSVRYLKKHAMQVFSDPNARKKAKIAMLLVRLGLPRKVFRAIRERSNRWN